MIKELDEASSCDDFDTLQFVYWKASIIIYFGRLQSPFFKIYSGIEADWLTVP